MEQDHVVWGAAFTLLRQHEHDAPGVIAARIAELQLAGEEELVEVWKSIGHCMGEIMRAHQDPAN